METPATDIRVSVVMCTYNGARYVARQLDTILGQTLPPFEVIVQDDGSTDNTWTILEDYARRDLRIRLYRNDGPHGINHNFFSAMRKADGDLIALSDQDDLWEPQKLAWQIEALGDALLCSGGSEPFSDEGFPVTTDRRRPNFHILRMAYIGVLPGHTLLLRRTLLRYLQDADACPYLYDWQLQLIAAAAERVAYVDRTLVHFRRHATAATAIEPASDHLVSRGGRHFLWTTLRYHRTLQAEVRKRMAIVEKMLTALPFDTSARSQCLTMARLQQRHGFAAFCQRTAFFVRNRRNLSYADEPSSWKAWLRALYFNYSCGYYYRGVLTPSPSKA